jgi:hypothetical protein
MLNSRLNLGAHVSILRRGPTRPQHADTVTEMREVKHACRKGILAQRGIEL